MPTKRRLVIHLGDHKTGSTAIQQVLVSGRVQAQFVAGLEALIGLVMITWSASFMYLEMAKFWGKN